MHNPLGGSPQPTIPALQSWCVEITLLKAQNEAQHDAQIPRTDQGGDLQLEFHDDWIFLASVFLHPCVTVCVCCCSPLTSLFSVDCVINYIVLDFVS
jgi:hypothetical protein